MIIAEYKTEKGEILPIREFKEGRNILCALNTNKTEFESYINTLVESGYEIHFRKATASASENPDDKNLFFVLTCTENNAYAAFFPTLCRVQVIFDSIAPLHSYEKPAVGNFVPMVTQSYISFGMCYVIKLCDGKLVVIDGGVSDKDCERELWKVILDNTPEGQKPVISMWFFTHSDLDHILMAADLMDDFRENLTIEGFAYIFPDDSVYTYAPREEIEVHIDTFEKSIEKNFPEVPVYPLYTGDEFYFSGVKAEVLFCFDVMHPGSIVSPNWESAAMKFTFNDKNTVLFLGDCMSSCCKKMAEIHGDYLKSDVLQVAHHGLAGGNLAAYKLIDPQICLWTTMEERFKGLFKNEKEHVCIGEGGCDFNAWIRDDTVRKREHYHSSYTVTVNMENLVTTTNERMRKHDFGHGIYDEDFMYAYPSFCKDRKEFMWDKKVISNSFNESTNEYDCISIIKRKKYSAGTTMTVRCSLEKCGTPTVLLTDDIRTVDGAAILGERIEVRALRSGFGVWKIGAASENAEPVKLAFSELPIKENELFDIYIAVKPGSIAVNVCGKTLEVNNISLPSEFNFGITACEGAVCFKSVCIVQES